MPTVRKLSSEEVQAWENRGKGTRKLIEEEYNSILSDYSIGEYGIAELGPEESRLKAAATRRGLVLVFRRTKGPQLRFHVETPSETAAPGRKSAPKPKATVAAALSSSEQKRPRGRPRKDAA
jgi:hypothetical protein